MRSVAVLVVILTAAGCSATTPPSPSQGADVALSPSPSVCASLATVRAFLSATQRFDGASAAALFTPDGYIDVLNEAPPPAHIRSKGDAIARFVAHPIDYFPTSQLRAIEVTRQPQGCDTTVTWAESDVPANPGPPYKLRVTATVRDGKIASVVYDWDQP